MRERSLPKGLEPAQVIDRARGVLAPLGFVLTQQRATSGRWLLPKTSRAQGSLALFRSLRLTIKGGDLKVFADCSSYRDTVKLFYFLMAAFLGLPALIAGVYSLSVGELGGVLASVAVPVLLVPMLVAVDHETRRSMDAALDGFVDTIARRPITRDRPARREPAPAAPQRPSRISATACRGPSRCSYCHDDLGSEPVMVCPRCETRFHRECWDELGPCPTLGCARPASRSRQGVA